jgi:ParB family transcriptional regulator, chromosome partitioning protein
MAKKRKSFSINKSLSKGLEETMHAAEGYSGELFVDVVPLERLELDPENPRELSISMDEIRRGIDSEDAHLKRKQSELESLSSLSKSISNQGLINPIVVYKNGDNYRLVAGERRTLASLVAGKKSIQARILDSKPNTLNRFILQWAENIEREDLSLWERLSNIRSIVSAYAKTHEKVVTRITAAELSDLIGISSSQAAQYKVVLQGSDDLIQAIQEDVVANLDKAAFIAKAPFHRQSALISLCKQAATLKELKAALSNVSVEKAKPNQAALAGTFKVAINNEAVAKVLIDALLNTPSYAHLKKTVSYDKASDAKSLKKTFTQLIKKIEQEVI